MSIPETIHSFIQGATNSAYPVSPFVRNNDAGFPAIVYEFDGDEFKSPRPESVNPRLVRYTVHCLARSMAEAETMVQLIVAETEDEQSGCPMRPTLISREYEDAYDGQRAGLYITSITLEFFQ